MKSTEKKAVESKGLTFAQGRIWTEEQLSSYRKYQSQYRKDHYRSFTARFNNDTDTDVIQYLENQESLTDALRRLVRNEIKRTQEEK